jgi:uncharacterized protein YyaL (SSP411 family)
MLKAYVEAFKSFREPAYLESAIRSAEFIDEFFIQDQFRLNRNFKNNKSTINAFLDDYALLIEAYTALYEIGFDERWLYIAKNLLNYAISHFFNESSGMFNYTSDVDPPLIARKMELSDNVIPASNSVMAKNLFRLGNYFYDQDFLEKSSQMAHNMAANIEASKQPNFFSNWCDLYADLTWQPFEIAIVGPKYRILLEEINTYYLPNAMLLGGKDEGTLELLKDKLQEETLIYVCQNKVCKYPVKSVEEALVLMADQ